MVINEDMTTIYDFIPSSPLTLLTVQCAFGAHVTAGCCKIHNCMPVAKHLNLNHETMIMVRFRCGLVTQLLFHDFVILKDC